MKIGLKKEKKIKRDINRENERSER